jgi:hypothetical protein
MDTAFTEAHMASALRAVGMFRGKMLLNYPC